MSDSIDKRCSECQIRRICDTCKHNPPKKDKWPCVDCDMREPADRWERQDAPEANVGDMISRQAVIDVIFSEPLYETGMKKRSAEEVVPAIFEKIKGLPPAESEIIYCEDCKYADEKPIADGRHWCILNNGYFSYCSEGERRIRNDI